MAKKDANIKKRSEAIKDKADKLNAMLNEVRSKKRARTIRIIRTTTAADRKEEKKDKRKEISSIDSKDDNKRRRPANREVSYAEVCAVQGSVKAKEYHTDIDGREDWAVVREKKKEEGTIQKWIEVPKRTRRLRPSLRRWRG